MNKIRKILKLGIESKLSNRAISRTVGASRPIVAKYLKAFESSALDIDKLDSLSDSELLNKMDEFTSSKRQTKYEKLTGEFEYYVKELKTTGVTLHVLWTEYKEKNKNGYMYSQFCYHFSKYIKKNKLSMHIEQKAGDKLYVDFTGKKMAITDAKTGEKHEMEIFVAVLGASEYTYVEAIPSQRKEDWIKVNASALEFIGGVPAAIVPDCLKSAVTKVDKYEPEINPVYEDFANHYNTVILPARTRKPKDKALVENAVKIVYTRIFAPLRNRVFHSLDELNEAIWEKLDEHNDRKFQKLNTTRSKLLQEIDLPALKPLPAERYEVKGIECRKVQFNYHVYLSDDKHYYSVPYKYRGKKVKIKYTINTVEIFYNNLRIAFHKRCLTYGDYTTNKEHMPSHHKFYAKWTPQRFINWGKKQGAFIEQVISKILQNRQYAEQAFRSCLGVLSLEKKYGIDRVELACKRAIEHGAFAYKAIKKILDKGLDKIIELQEKQDKLPEHDNIRGSKYFEKEAANE